MAKIKKYTIEFLRSVARKRGGRCISARYISNTSKYQWQCAKGHSPWMATEVNIVRGRWCPFCAGKGKTVADVRILAEKRGFKLISKKYLGVHYKYKFRCKAGHPFYSTFASVRSGTGCPECGGGFGERLCRYYFEQCFKAKFPKNRPSWLVNPKGIPLELDGYCEKARIAFEHQGKFHYEANYLHGFSQKRLNYRKKIDSLKRRMCQARGIRLVIVPEIIGLTSLDSLPEFLDREFTKHRLQPTTRPQDVKVNWKKIYNPELENEFRKFLKAIEITLRSSHYLGAVQPLKYQCNKCHYMWSAPPTNLVRAGTRCPRCAGNLQKTAQALKQEALKVGLVFLGGEYKNNSTAMSYRCRGCATELRLRPGNVLMGRGCHYCSGSRLTISKFQKIAKKHGGLCLSKKYTNSVTKLRFECKNGHRWYALPANIRKGQWCDKCARPSFVKFGQARRWASKLGLKSAREWQAFTKQMRQGEPALRYDVPRAPEKTYAGKGWKNWQHWLGNEWTAGGELDNKIVQLPARSPHAS